MAIAWRKTWAGGGGGRRDGGRGAATGGRQVGGAGSDSATNQLKSFATGRRKAIVAPTSPAPTPALESWTKPPLQLNVSASEDPASGGARIGIGATPSALVCSALTFPYTRLRPPTPSPQNQYICRGTRSQGLNTG